MHYTPRTKGYNNCGYGVYWVLADLGIHLTHPKHAANIMINALPLPPLEVLQEKFDYNPETGILLRRATQKPAGYTNGRGWLRVKIAGVHYKVHRIVWKMHHGEDPPANLQIDHINRDRHDNRITNLRVVTCKENIHNSEGGGGHPKQIMLVNPNGQGKIYNSIKEAAESANIHAGNLCKVLKGHRKICGGYTAYYA